MEQNKNTQEQEFRNSLSTVDTTGKRKWIYAKKPKGKFWFWRNIFGFALLAFFILAPMIKVKGSQFILLDFFERKFVLFGVIFWPQDSFIFFLIMIAFILFIILFTVIYGRLFCGWACPQTIFLELIFRRIEHWIEGDFAKQKKLRQQNWNGEKIWKKGLKTSIFILISVFIIHVFSFYLFGFEDVISIVKAGPAEHPKGVIALAVFSFLFFGVYSWFREQVCIIACPYGRMQGVLLDRKTIVVSYDYKRGEPRGILRKGEDRKSSGKGDCVQCQACLQVCPTGIDIRNGTQLECVNCTACIDACNETMERTGLPKGLIRYASEESIVKKEKFRFTPRMIAYSFVLLGLLVFLTSMLTTRKPIEASILRTPGLLFQEQKEEQISNLYNLRLINKSRKDLDVEIQLLSHEGSIYLPGGKLTIEGQESLEKVFFVYLDKDELSAEKTKITIGVFAEDQQMQKVSVWFIGPK